MNQIDIPDLDDDEVYTSSASGPPVLSTLHIPSKPAGPFRGAELGFHGRSGSATSNDSYGGPPSAGSATGSGFRFPPPGAGPGSAGSQTGGSAFSFPRKASFASLRAAIKGGQAQPPGGPISTAMPSAARSVADPTTPKRAAHARNDSQLSAASRGGASSATGGGASSASGAQAQGWAMPAGGAQYAGSVGARSMHQHAPHSSIYSEHSLAASSSAGSGVQHATMGSLGGSAAASNNGMPPLPPFPEEYSAHMTYYGSEGGGYGVGTTPRRSRDDERMAVSQGEMALQYARLQHSDPMDEAQAAYFGQQHPAGSHWPQQSAYSAGANAQGGYDAAYGALMQQPRTPTLGLRRGPSGAGSRAASGLGTLPPGIGSVDPKTPAEYALNVLMSRFITIASAKVETCLINGDVEPSLQHVFGLGIDEQFDSLLVSLAHVSRKSAKPVIDSLWRWRLNQLNEAVEAGLVRKAMPLLGAASVAILGGGAPLGVKEAQAVLARRKTLASTHLLARALQEVAKQLGSGSLGEAHLNELEGNVFGLLLECSKERVVRSAMQQAAFEEVAALLGELSRTHFMPIGDRFVSLLEQCTKSAATNPKEAELLAEVAIMGTRRLTITVYPMELFEEGAEFVDILSRYFAGAHGQRLKSAYADALIHLLLPVAKSASAEMNHPTWVKALDAITPRAFVMASKPRYWPVAYPLYVACLCASPEDKFLQNAAGWNWFACVEAGVAKFKDRATRVIVLNAAVRLIWSYMFRCRESSSTTTKRLEAFFRLWFPPQRPTVLPQDVSLSPHIMMVHLALYRHFDFGRDLVLDFLRHAALGGNTLSLQPEVLSRQRMTIAIRAVLLTLDAYVTEESPAFPASADFGLFEFDTEQREGTGDELPDSFTYPRPELAEAQVTFNDLIGKIALICDHQVGGVSVFDEATIITRIGASPHPYVPRPLPDEERYIWRTHPLSRISVAYQREHQPYLDLLRACVDAWPRCLSSSIPFASVLSALNRASFSVDPLLASAASESLRRIARQHRGAASAVVSGFMRWLFRIETAFWETHPCQTLLLSKVEMAVKLWIELLNIWLGELRRSQAEEQGMERTSAWATIDEVEAHGLFLLCSASRPLRRHAISVLRLVAVLDDAFLSPTRRQALTAARALGEDDEPTRIIHLLDMPCADFCSEDDAVLSESQRARVRKWRRPNATEPLSELAESEKGLEHTLWQHVLPRFLRMCLEHFPTTVAVFRSYVTNRTLAMESAVAVAAGTVPRGPGSSATAAANTTKGGAGSVAASSALGPDQTLMAENWKLYILALCTTTTSTEGSRGGMVGTVSHTRRSSEGGTSERVIAARDLFQKLVPFLASEHAHFRDAVVSALGNINGNLYRTLLETMQAVCSQLNEDFRTRSQGRSAGVRRSLRHDRLRTAVAHVLQLTSSHMARKETMGDQAIVLLIRGWVTDTFAFLTNRDIRPDWEFHRLRRHFSGVVEEFFNDLARIGETERYLTFDMRLGMFRLFREWHSFSQAAKDGPAKLANWLANVGEQYRDEKQREQILKLLRTETQLLSYHASSAMAALCQGAISLVGSAAPAPMSGSSLDAGSLLSWLEYLFLSPSAQNNAVARRALHALLLYNATHTDLVSKTVDHCFAEAEGTTAQRSFFIVLCDMLVSKSDFAVPPHQSLCLGLIKLGHPDAEMRRKAFELLDTVGRRHVPTLTMHNLEVGVGSPLPATYLRAQREISAHLAESFGWLKIAMLSEYTLRLPVIDLTRRATSLGLLPEWLHGINLSEDVGEIVAGEVPGPAFVILTNLLFLTIKYGDEHNFEIQDMWASLAEGSDLAANANVIVRFLAEQALRFRTATFVVQAKRAISCLSRTVVSPLLFAELCRLVEPGNMIPVPRDDAVPVLSEALQILHCARLEPMIADSTRGRQVFSLGQLALLFVGELTYDRSQQLGAHLPLLLHAIFMQVDNPSTFMQEQMMSMLEQVMRTLTSASGSKATVGPSDSTAKQKVEHLFAKGPSIFWSPSDLDVELDQTHCPRTMRATAVDLLSALQLLFPELRENWGREALRWATTAPVRHMACRSFQTFRILLPKTSPLMIADMLGRLSNTISDPSIDIQQFALEVLYTITAVVRASDINQTEVLSQIFWSCLACLSTTNEREFAEMINMLECLLDKLDVGARDTINMLRMCCPEGWEGEAGAIQPLVLRGLRSSVTSTSSFNVLARLAKIQDDSLIDSSGGRLAYLFVAALPWFLQSTDAPQTQDTTVLSLAEDIALLAEAEGKADMQRVATSIAKGRFRTKDDLVRQAVGCVKANYLPALGPDLAVQLLGLALNQHEWLRKQTMQVLKVFFQVIDTRSAAFANLGSELLMPLLRLLSSPLSAEALDVLDEPIAINGGPAANQILRMSLQWGKPSRRREQSSDASIFGAPDDSGWAVAHPQEMTKRSRINVQAVFKTWEMALETAPVGEVNFVDEFDPDDHATFAQLETAESLNLDDLGGTLNQLHDLSAFFVDDPLSPELVSEAPTSARYPDAASYFGDGGGVQVALSKILARSTYGTTDQVAMSNPSLSGTSVMASDDGGGPLAYPSSIEEARAAGLLPSLSGGGRMRSGSDSDSSSALGGPATFDSDDSGAAGVAATQPMATSWSRRGLFKNRARPSPPAGTSPGREQNRAPPAI